MRIKLDDKHYLASNAFCFWIAVEVQPGEKSKSKKIYEKELSGYYTTVEEAICSYIDRKWRSSVAEDLVSLGKEIEELKKEVRSWKPAVERRD